MRRVTFTTSSGITASGTAFGPFDNATNGVLWSNVLSGWDWDVNSATGEVTRGGRSYSVNVVIPDAEADRFFLALERDAVNNATGILSVDGWELSCVAVTGSVKRVVDGFVTYELSLYAKDPTWHRHTRYSLSPDGGESIVTTGLDYPTDYDFDYAGSSISSDIVTFETAAECLVGLTFYGPCDNPYARVTSGTDRATASNLYKVNAEASENERIVIDPLGRKVIGGSVYKVGAYGERSNLFDHRERGVSGSGSYIFERLPAGRISVSWPQSYRLDVDLIEERGILPWT